MEAEVLLIKFEILKNFVEASMINFTINLAFVSYSIDICLDNKWGGNSAYLGTAKGHGWTGAQIFLRVKGNQPLNF